MKKVTIAVFAVLAAASTAKAGGIQVNFDGGRNAQSFSALAAQAAPAPAPAAAVPAVRSYPGAFEAGNVAAMNATIKSAIGYAKANNRSAGLVSGLECLLKNGTVEQKEAFVYGPGVYVLPDSCVARPAKPQLKCISSTVCSWITETIIRTSCNPTGECMDTTVDVLRKTCEDLCN